MMRIVNIPSTFNKYDSEWYINFIRSYDSRFYINGIYLNLILSKVDEVNINIVLYVIYQILINDNLSTSSLNPKPSNGIELLNPFNLKPIGIYHVHLKNGYVLLWYLEWNEMGYSLRFLYEKHPPMNDNYKTIIESIYNGDNDGYNIELQNYFKDIKSILNFNILEYNKFVLFLLKNNYGR